MNETTKARLWVAGAAGALAAVAVTGVAGFWRLIKRDLNWETPAFAGIAVGATVYVIDWLSERRRGQ